MRARLEGFGAVNMMALEELAEADEALALPDHQRQDITDGIISTEEACAKSNGARGNASATPSRR